MAEANGSKPVNSGRVLSGGTSVTIAPEEYDELTLLCEQLEGLVEMGHDALGEDCKTKTFLALVEKCAGEQLEILKRAAGGR